MSKIDMNIGSKLPKAFKRSSLQKGMGLIMRKKVLVTEPINQKGLDYLSQHGCEIVMGSGPSEEAILRDAVDCNAILTRNGRINEKILKACPDLKVVSMHGVGVDAINVDIATQLGVQVTNAAKSNQTSVAEYAIGLILMLAKRSVAYNNGLKQGDADVRKLFGSDVNGKTLGIIGMGNIGTQVAKMAAHGLNMTIVGYSRHVKKATKTDFGTLTNDMDAVISSADFLSLHLPGSLSTARLIGKRELELMKPDAFLINTGRGEVIDETALIEILKEKRIKGAALDVFEGNLPEQGNPLLSMENVIVTPHTAAFTAEALERMAYQAALGVVEVLDGLPVTYAVNKIYDNFEENTNISKVMDFFRHEFGYN